MATTRIEIDRILCPVDFSELSGPALERAVRLLRKAVPDAARNLCKVTERVEAGAPWSEILRVANRMDADLIVMGSHTRGAVRRMFLGPTASNVVRRATCPVLLIHETRKQRPSAEAAEAVGRAQGLRAP